MPVQKLVVPLQRKRETTPPQSKREPQNNAKIAQLVEHDLAKVGVAGSSPVFRSKGTQPDRTLKIQNIVRQLNRFNNAKIAQLVEHDLAKVGVAGSSPVFRSLPIISTMKYSVRECPQPPLGLTDIKMSGWRNW